MLGFIWEWLREHSYRAEAARLRRRVEDAGARTLPNWKKPRPPPRRRTTCWRCWTRSSPHVRLDACQDLRADQRTGPGPCRGRGQLCGLCVFSKSPRNLSLDAARALALSRPVGLAKVALVVDPDDAMLDAILAQVPVRHDPASRGGVARARGRDSRALRAAGHEGGRHCQRGRPAETSLSTRPWPTRSWSMPSPPRARRCRAVTGWPLTGADRRARLGAAMDAGRRVDARHRGGGHQADRRAAGRCVLRRRIGAGGEGCGRMTAFVQAARASAPA